MNLSSLATNAFATTRSTFKGLAEAAVAAGENTDAPAPAPVAEEKPAAPKREVKAAGQADSAEAKPKGVRRGTVLDSYA
jgi:cell division septation protein DedD